MVLMILSWIGVVSMLKSLVVDLKMWFFLWVVVIVVGWGRVGNLLY